MRSKKILLATTCIYFLFVSASAYAQVVDYGNLQELFREPVTVSATGKPQRASEAPVALEIITADKIRRMGVQTIPEILQRINGISHWQSTRSFSDVGIRGQNGSQNPTLRVMINGRQVFVDLYGYTDWSLLPVQIEEIQQIEIVKSPSSALYGFNAVTGVINIITYNPRHNKKNIVGIVGGSGDYGRAYAVKTADISEKTSLRVSGSTETFDEFALRSKTKFAELGTFKKDNYANRMMADVVTQLSDKTQLRVEGSYASMDGEDSMGAYFAFPAEKFFWSGKTSLTSDTSIGLLEANLYMNNYKGSYEGVLIDLFGAPAIFENNVTILQLQDLFKVGTEHTFRLQVEGRHNTATSESYVGPFSKVGYDVLAANAMWNWALASNLEWNNAARVDHVMLKREGPPAAPTVFPDNSAFNRDITAYSFNSGLLWKMTDVHSLRASYARGLQIPSLFHLGFSGQLDPTYEFASDPTLDPVVTDHYEIGYNQLFPSFDGKFEVAAFYRQMQGLNEIFSKSYYIGPVFVAQASEIGDSETVGVDFALKGRYAQNWTWDLGYTWQNTVDDFNPIAKEHPTAVSIHYEDTVPHHVVKAHLGYAIGPWETDIYGEMGSSFKAVDSTFIFYDTIPMHSYYTLGGRVAHNFENGVTIALSGTNLQSARVANNFGLENERMLFLTLSKQF